MLSVQTCAICRFIINFVKYAIYGSIVFMAYINRAFGPLLLHDASIADDLGAMLYGLVDDTTQTSALAYHYVYSVRVPNSYSGYMQIRTPGTLALLSEWCRVMYESVTRTATTHLRKL